MIDFLENHYADPHIKRSERISGRYELMEFQRKYHVFLNVWLRTVQAKMKKFEWGKHGKIRAIANLGIPASLQGFKYCEFFKIAMATKIFFTNGGFAEFVPCPDPTTLARVFQEHINCSRECPIVFHYFSDDSILSLFCDDGYVRHWNLDIACCDASHTDAVFTFAQSLFPDSCASEIKRVFDQLRQPVEVRDVHDSKRRVVLYTVGRRLYSGSTLTTLINNVACLLIVHSIATFGKRSTEAILSAGERVGYQLTVETCTRHTRGPNPVPIDDRIPEVSLMQFLKNSPVFDVNGVLFSFFNMGVFLRGLGTCNGDLPGRGDITERARRFVAAHLQGTYPYDSFPFADNLRIRFPPREDALFTDFVAKQRHVENYELVSAKRPLRFATSDQIYRRYDLTPEEYTALDDVALQLDVNDVFHNAATSRILLVDYGLPILT